ncbi:MAG: thiamine phosphate synthase [Pseudomonadota bacterium]
MQLNKTDPTFGKLRRVARRASSHLPGNLPPVLVFTDPERSPPPKDIALQMPRRWGLVYRHFGDPECEHAALELAKLSRVRDFQLLIGADPVLANRVGAHGVHWPERMLMQARRWVGAFSINTLSAHTLQSVCGPQPIGIDARILSTVFNSNSPSASAPLGAQRFRNAALRAAVPVYGLGGLNAKTAGAVCDVAGLSWVSKR